MSLLNTLRLLTFCASLLALAPAHAGETLVNSEVSVDVTGKDTASARSEAMNKAASNALLDLLSRFTSLGQAQEIISELDNKRIAAMVRGTEVLDEKMTDNRYRARLLISFDGDDISALINNPGMAKNDDDDAPPVGSFLVLPVYEEQATSSLWEDNNPWLHTWRKVGLEVPSGDVIVPFGDTRDIASVDSRTATAATYASLMPMIIRYGVTDVMVMQAKFSETPDMVLEVVKRRFNRTQNEVLLLTYRADPQETKENLLMRAARDIAGRTQAVKTEELSNVKKVRGGERNSIMLLANITTISSWTELRKKIAELPMTDKLDVLAVSPLQADLMLHYRGNPESLATAIEASKLRLVKHDNYWVVSRD